MPFKIIKRKEYETLQEIKKDYINLTKEKNIEEMGDLELLLYNLPIAHIGTRILLRMLKKEK